MHVVSFSLVSSMQEHKRTLGVLELPLLLVSTIMYLTMHKQIKYYLVWNTVFYAQVERRRERGGGGGVGQKRLLLCTVGDGRFLSYF